MSSSKSVYINFPGAPYTHSAAIKSAQTVLTDWEIIDGQGIPPTDESSSTSQSDAVAPSNHSLYFCDYDYLPFEYLSPSPLTTSTSYPKCSSYMIRKALIRKHYLAHSLNVFATKQSDEEVGKRIRGLTPKTWRIEIQFADELDELLVDDLFDLDLELKKNEEREKEIDQGGEGKGKENQDIKWFILKPGMADRGNGIRLFSTLEELRDIFEEFEDDSDDDEEEEDQDEQEENPVNGSGNDYGQTKSTSVMMSQLRHFVIQEYLSQPLLIAPPSSSNPSLLSSGRKFHLRAYVLCIGGLQVCLFDEMLALFAPLDYQSPSIRLNSGSAKPEDEQESDDENSSSESKGMVDLRRHLTNTCLQEDGFLGTGRPEEENVHLWSDLVGSQFSSPSSKDDEKRTEGLSQEQIQEVKELAARNVGDTFMAAAKAGAVHWQIWPNAWEIFGVDLMVGWDGEEEEVDSQIRSSASESEKTLKVWLLEINAQPDFAQTGSRLSETVDELFKSSLQLVVGSGEGGKKDDWKVGESRNGMTLCFGEEMGRG